MKRFFIGLATGVVLVVALLTGAVADRLWGIPLLDRFVSLQPGGTSRKFEQRVLTEESVVIEVAERVSPSVVTVSVTRERRVFDPFMDPFGAFRLPRPERRETIEQDIGSGFILSADGLVVTNRHVVDDPNVKYKVITKDDREFEVKKIYRDPANDLAILQIDPNGLEPLELGDSEALRVGQFVIAIGTALGEFRHTVTTGVISGLGRGIQAGDPFRGVVEQLDNVIQTDAAINPGNSGGPLLNSAGQVIGVNVAVAGGAENVGFALPINVVKESLEIFNATGRFSRAFLGIRYQMISRESAILNEVSEGAFVIEVIEGSAASDAGITPGDILTNLDGQAIRSESGGLALIIRKKKVGDRVDIQVWRDGEFLTLQATLEEAGE
ncbi:trypsin-like peptidase domain-containing protein [Patescibacteria group bacterium]|nr:trypsin-like peptidase domain-containing protein [Patescibacteria group bacterium]